MIKRVVMLLFLFCMQLVPLREVTAQTSSDNWQIPLIECGADCQIIRRVDEQGNLYIYIERTQPARQALMYFVERNTRQVIEYDLLQIDPPTGIRRDFIAFSINELVVFDYQSAVPLTLLNLETGQTIPLDLNMSDQLEECNIYSPNRFQANLYRSSEHRIILCSRDENGISYIQIARLTNGALTIENSFEMGASRTPGFRYTPPWKFIAGGLDREIYVGATANNLIFNSINPEADGAYDPTDFQILRFDPITQTWDSVLIEASSERWRIGEPSVISYFIGADSAGNMYFLHTWFNLGQMFELVKYGASGEAIWHLTEADFGGNAFYDALLVGGNEFIFDSGDGNLQYEILNEVTSFTLLDTNNAKLATITDGF